MLNASELAARHLVDARRAGKPGDRLPESLRPTSNEEALKVQRTVIDMSGETIGGWKCSIPSGNKLLVAPLPASTIHWSSPCPTIPYGAIAEIEPEIAFILKHDLPPRSLPYSEDEVRESVRETRMALELMASRFADLESISWLENLADSAKHQGMFMGPVIVDALHRPIESFQLSIGSPDGQVFHRQVRHPQGHPIGPLHWLANFLSSRGETLEADKVITTGSYAGIIEVPMMKALTISYEDLGSFSVEFR